MTGHWFCRQTILMSLPFLTATAVLGQSAPVFGAEELSIPITIGGLYDGYARVTIFANSNVKWQIPKTTIPPWLVLGPEQGTGPQTLEMYVRPNQFTQEGLYTASLTVTPTGGTTGDTMAVHVRVGTGAGASPINASPANLVLRGLTTSDGVYSTVKLTDVDGSGGTPFQVKTSSTKWLTVTADHATTPATLTVSVILKDLIDGYTDHVITIIPSTGATLHIPVSVHKYASVPDNFTVDFSPREFKWVTGPSNPPSQSAAIRNTTGIHWIGFAISNGNWLRVGSLTGHGTVVRGEPTEGAVWALAEPSGLLPGNYQGTVRVETIGGSYPPRSFNVSLTVEPGVAPRITAVTNGASLQPGTVARGLVVSMWGAGCGGGTGIYGRVASGLVLRQLAGTRLLFDGIPAPLLYVGDAQINAVVPYEIHPSGSIPVQLEVNGIRSAPASVQVAEAAPAIFSMDLSGGGPGAILNQNGKLNSQNNPAARGSVIVMFSTGEGLVTPSASTGEIILGSKLRRPVLPVSVTLGGIPATVQYAGSAPGFVSGALQVNVLIPPNGPTGDKVPVVLTVGSTRSPGSITVSIH